MPLLLGTSCAAETCNISAGALLLMMAIMLGVGVLSFVLILLVAKGVAKSIKARTGRDVQPTATRWGLAYGFGLIGLLAMGVWRLVARVRGRPGQPPGGRSS
jgi:hypothetical protein